MKRFLAWVLVPLALFASQVASALDTPPEVSVTVETPTARPGDVVKGVATVTFGQDLHGYQNPQDDPNIIPIDLKGIGFELSSVQYPKGEKKVVGGLPDPYYVHSGTIQIPFEFKAPNQVPDGGLKVTFGYQQCDAENCFPPGAVDAAIPVSIEGATTGSPAPTTGETPAAGISTPPSNPTPSAPREGLAGLLQSAFENSNWLLLAGVLLLIGLAINLTPCVYPLIPVTISFFAGQAKDGGNKTLLAFNYMVGIAFSYGLVGGIAAASGGVFGQLFQNPWFNAFLGVFMIVLALSMFDLYQIGLPQVVTKQLKGRSGPVGSFLMGMLVGVGAAPCAGPLIILLFTEVAKLNNAPLAVISFVLVGIGLGIPYFILGLTSNAQSALPKAGGWMKAIKALMGLAVIFFGLGYFVQALPGLFNSSITAWTYVAFFLICAAFMVWWDLSSSDKRTWIIKSVGALAFGILGGVTYANHQADLRIDSVKKEFRLAGGVSSEWQKFTPESWTAAVESGKPIFVDATANWCAECKVIERTVFEDPRFIGATKDVVLLKIDWSTGVPQDYMDATRKQFNIKGLPHLVFAKPGGEVVSVLNSLHSVEELKENLKKAGAKL